MSYHTKYEYIARMIRPVQAPNEDEYDYVTRLDRIAFKKWEDGKIGLKQCLKEFKKNNAIPDVAEIDLADFKGWLTEELHWKEYTHEYSYANRQRDERYRIEEDEKRLFGL